jgi:hypothetical protein
LLVGTEEKHTHTPVKAAAIFPNAKTLRFRVANLDQHLHEIKKKLCPIIFYIPVKEADTILQENLMKRSGNIKKEITDSGLPVLIKIGTVIQTHTNLYKTILIYFMKVYRAGAELLHTDRQTNGDEANVRFLHPLLRTRLKKVPH